MKPAKLVGIVIAGVLFGPGLAISGMTDPARVIGFLDVFGKGSGAGFRDGGSGCDLWGGNVRDAEGGV